MQYLNTKSALYLSIVALIATIFGGFVYIDNIKLQVEGKRLNEQYVIRQVVQKDDTANEKDWKTYRNDEYGFEFRYPEFWEESRVKPVVTHDETGIDFIEFVLDATGTGWADDTYEVFVISMFPNEYWEKENLIVVRNDCVVSALYPDDKCGGIYLGANNGYHFSYGISQDCPKGWTECELRGYIQEMMNTFKVLEIDPAAKKEVSGWKTYRNDEYNFKFQRAETAETAQSSGPYELIATDQNGKETVLVEDIEKLLPEKIDKSDFPKVYFKSRTSNAFYFLTHGNESECCVVNVYTFDLDTGTVTKLEHISGDSMGFIAQQISSSTDKILYYKYLSFEGIEPEIHISDLKTDTVTIFKPKLNNGHTLIKECGLDCFGLLEWAGENSFRYAVYSDVSEGSDPWALSQNNLLEMRTVSLDDI